MSDIKPSWWYVSFADEDGFLGGVFVRGWDITMACAMAHHLGINPGGEAMGVPLSDNLVPPPEFRDRLLGADEIDAAGEAADNPLPVADQSRPDPSPPPPHSKAKE